MATNPNNPSVPGSTPPGAETYNLAEEPAAPAPVPPSPAPFTPPSPSIPATSHVTPAPTSPAGSRSVTDGYRKTVTLSIKPEILQWIPAAGMILIFILQFFTWVALRPGGQDIVTQNPWQAAFGGRTLDTDLKTEPAAKLLQGDKEQIDLSMSLFTLLYLLVFLAALVVIVGVVIQPMLTVKLPPQVEALLPWKWAIATGAAALPLIVLCFQLLVGYSMEDQYRASVEKDLKWSERGNLDTKAGKKADMDYGLAMQALQRSNWLRTAVLFHFIVLISTAMMFWYGQRENRPLPCLELRW